ncbi:hypothetical protein WMY93_009939 [Mugilogobius chulae]|uniref:Uncharacterized protein n=1 Tax=Mugilogobius chulae TaxID=88201 RepID=A0AAW0P7A6_9GOBI
MLALSLGLLLGVLLSAYTTEVQKPAADTGLGYRWSPSRVMIRNSSQRLQEMNNRTLLRDDTALKHLGILRRPRYVHRESGRWLYRNKTGSAVPAVWSEPRFVAARLRHPSTVTMEITNYPAPVRRKQNPAVDYSVLRPLAKMSSSPYHRPGRGSGYYPPHGPETDACSSP